MKIIGIMLVKDESIYIERSIENVISFCDRLIILDNLSTDGTWEIIQRLANQHSRIRCEQVSNSKRTHQYIEEFAGQDVFIFGIDGDELYDPAGLRRLKVRLHAGEFADAWCIYGHVLHVTAIDSEHQMARGFTTPQARSMTKLYNFSILESWHEPRQQRLHGRKMVFKDGYSTENSVRTMQDEPWSQCDLRCLHMCFVPRSINAGDPEQPLGARKNISELNTERDLGEGWKVSKYAVGAQITRDARPFMGNPPLGSAAAPFIEKPSTE